jgi:hypothetical protein
MLKMFQNNLQQHEIAQLLVHLQTPPFNELFRRFIEQKMCEIADVTAIPTTHPHYAAKAMGAGEAATTLEQILDFLLTTDSQDFLRDESDHLSDKSFI